MSMVHGNVWCISWWGVRVQASSILTNDTWRNIWNFMLNLCIHICTYIYVYLHISSTSSHLSLSLSLYICIHKCVCVCIGTGQKEILSESSIKRPARGATRRRRQPWRWRWFISVDVVFFEWIMVSSCEYRALLGGRGALLSVFGSPFSQFGSLFSGYGALWEIHTWMLSLLGGCGSLLSR